MLIAVAAFMAGVVVTVALIRSRRKENKPIGENREDADTQEDDTHRKRER